MTRKLPPKDLEAARANHRWVSDAARHIFREAAPWEPLAAMAALYRMRPGLGVEADAEMHDRHMREWPRNAAYFGRLCALLKIYGIGSQWGDE